MVLVHPVQDFTAALRCSTGNREETGCCSLDPGALPGPICARVRGHVLIHSRITGNEPFGSGLRGPGLVCFGCDS